MLKCFSFVTIWPKSFTYVNGIIWVTHEATFKILHCSTKPLRTHTINRYTAGKFCGDFPIDFCRMKQMLHDEYLTQFGLWLLEDWRLQSDLNEVWKWCVYCHCFFEYMTSVIILIKHKTGTIIDWLLTDEIVNIWNNLNQPSTSSASSSSSTSK